MECSRSPRAPNPESGSAGAYRFLPLLRLGLLAAAMALPGCGARCTPAGAARTAPPPTAVATPDTVPHPPFRQLWRITSTGAPFARDNSVVAGDTLFFAVSTSYGSMNLLTGKPVWEKRPGGRYLAYDGETLYVIVPSQRLIACDPRTGRTRWSLPLPARGGGPMSIYRGSLIFEFWFGKLAALDTSTHKLRWTSDLTHPRFPRAFRWRRPRPGPFASAPLIVNRGVYIFGRLLEGSVTCLDADTGEFRWHVALESDNLSQVRTITSDSRRLYAVLASRTVMGVDADTGKILWTTKVTEPAPGWQQPAVVDGWLFFTAANGTLRALRAADGATQWQLKLTRRRDSDVSAPTVHAGQVLVQANDQLLAYNADGRKLWAWRTGVLGQPVLTTVLEDGLLLRVQNNCIRYAMITPPGPRHRATRR